MRVRYFEEKVWITQKKILLCFYKPRKRRQYLRNTDAYVFDFEMRPVLGEFNTTFQNLMDHPDEAVFFNYMRISNPSYKGLRDLILPHIRPIGSNWRGPISGEEKFVLTIR